MSGTDPWAKKWTLNYADNPKLRDLILVDSGKSPSIFTLKPIHDPDNGALVAYRVDFNKNEMMPCWNGCYLFPRGGDASALEDDAGTLPNLPLTPWTAPTGSADPPNQPDYQAVATEIEQENDTHPKIARLEGDIHRPDTGKAESVTLWQVKTTNPPTKKRDILTNHTFLGLSVFSDDVEEENGIAHGND